MNYYLLTIIVSGSLQLAISKLLSAKMKNYRFLKLQYYTLGGFRIILAIYLILYIIHVNILNLELKLNLIKLKNFRLNRTITENNIQNQIMNNK